MILLLHIVLMFKTGLTTFKHVVVLEHHVMHLYRIDAISAPDTKRKIQTLLCRN